MDGRSGNVHFARILCVREFHCQKDIFVVKVFPAVHTPHNVTCYFTFPLNMCFKSVVPFRFLEKNQACLKNL